jgi:hypothetical protein
MAAETISVGYLLNKAWVILAGLWWYNKKQTDRQSEKLREEVLALTTNASEAKLRYITHSKLKEVIKEELGHYKEDQVELKALITHLAEHLAVLRQDMAVQNAVQRRRKEDKE